MSTLSSTSPALVVDLDGSLIRADLLHESLLRLVQEHPRALFSLPGWLRRGKAAVKREIAALVTVDATLLPYRTEVLDFIAEARREGRTVILATASHESLARKVAAHLGLFDAVLATGETTNLAGANKLAAIREHLGGQPFEYIGDSAQDLPVWAEATAGHFVGRRVSVQRALEKMERPGRTFGIGEGRLRPVLRALRLPQWAKNVLIFVPAILAHQLQTWPLLLTAFLSFSLCASGVYVLNDLLDLQSDRRHARKRHRPFASGLLSVRSGLVLATVLPLLGIALCLALPPAFAGWLGGYYCLTLAYSARLKQKPVVDVIVLAGLYTIRLFAGASVAQVETSTWLLAFSMFLFLSLAFAKRFTELTTVMGTNDRLPGRGYVGSDLDIVRAGGMSSGYLAVLVLALYIDSGNVRLLYHHPGRLWLACPALLYWITRLWFFAQRRVLHDDPVVFAWTDPKSWMVGAWCIAVAILANVK